MSGYATPSAAKLHNPERLASRAFHDDDRIGTHAELRPVSETMLVSIDLGFDRKASCDHQGNCGYERASFDYRTPAGGLAVGEVVDVHVACR